MKKIYVIGDIHGCIKTLEKLYSTFEPGSDVYTVGDLVDKGPNVSDVIDFCINNNIKPVFGNHEQFFLHNIDLLKGSDNSKSVWSNKWGGIYSIVDYKYKTNKLVKHIEFIKNLPLYYQIDTETDRFFITHGFALPYYTEKNNIENLGHYISNRLHGKYFDIENIESLRQYGVINIIGHDAFEKVQVHDLYYGIDTGCVYGGKLSAIELTTKEITSIDVIDTVDYQE